MTQRKQTLKKKVKKKKLDMEEAIMKYAFGKDPRRPVFIGGL
jgi:hypothetical protein